MVLIFPGIWWGWAPPLRLYPFSEDPLAHIGAFLIPGLILGTYLSAATMRMTRTMMLEVLRQDYVRTAWAKGLRERLVVIRHAMKNALIPVVTLIGLQLPILVGGSVIIETLFNLPGLGSLFVQALSIRDYPMVSGINLFFATFILFNNLLIDLLYALPRPEDSLPVIGINPTLSPIPVGAEARRRRGSSCRLLLPLGPGEAVGPARRGDRCAVRAGGGLRRRGGARPRPAPGRDLRRLQGSSAQHLLGTDHSRARLPEPQHLRRPPVAAGRLRGHHGGGAGGAPSSAACRGSSAADLTW